MFMIGSLLVLFVCSPARAGLLQMQSDSYFARERGDDLGMRAPFYEQFTANYLAEEQNSQLDFNFSYYYDFETNNYTFNLHQLDGSTSFDRARGHFSLGRSFQTYHLIKATTTDSASVDYSFFNGQLKTGFLWGYGRQLDLDGGAAAANIWSTFTDIQTDAVFPWNFGLRFESRDFTSLGRGHQYWTKESVRKEFSFALHPELLVNAEENIQDENGYRYELGMNFYPSVETMFGFSVQEYDIGAYEEWESPIFAIFSRGAMREASVLFGQSLGPLYTSFEVGGSQYDAGSSTGASGSRGEWLLRLLNHSLQAENSVFRISSYGGWVAGDRFDFQLPLTRVTDLDFNDEYVYYEKITSEKNKAVSLRAGLTFHWQQIKLWAAGEYNSNNFYSQDIRFLTQLTVYDWREL